MDAGPKVVRIAVGFPVNPAAADAWLAGQEPPGNWDLLDSVEFPSAVLYIARMHSRQEWPQIATLLIGYKPARVLYRTDRLGLVRLLVRSGGEARWKEPTGHVRLAIEASALSERLFARIMKFL